MFDIYPIKLHHKAIRPVSNNRLKSCAGIMALTSIIIPVMLSTPARAATSVWSAEQLIPMPTQATNLRTAINVTGASVMVWDQYIPGSADATHLYGRWQVYASVCMSQPAPQTPLCSAPQAFTDGINVPDATNAGAVITPSGTVTVFWNTTATPTLYSAYSSSSDAGATWSQEQRVPGDVGYTLLSGVYSEVGPSVGIDGSGNIIVAMVNPPTTYWTMSTVFGVQTLVKDASTNTWGQPVPLSNAIGIFSSAKLFVNADGQALLNMGFTSFRRWRDSVTGAWNWGPQTVSTAGLGQIYSASTGFDAGGKGYFVYRNRYGGAYLSTSTPTAVNSNPAWTTPRRVTKFDILGSSLVVRGSSSNHAIIYGIDINTGNVRAAVTTDGGATWGGLINMGLGSNPHAAGSANGLYALSWDSAGANNDRYFVATGTGSGTGTAAWMKTNLADNNASGPVAIAGNAPNGSAKAGAGWARWDVNGDVLGVSLGSANP